MKRFLYLALCLLLVLTMCVCFVACKDEEEEGGTTATTQQPGSSTSTSTTGSSQPDVPTHEHTFEEEYTYDEENHFYKATCEHENEVSGVEPHSFDTFTGVCKCGYSVDPDVAQVIAAIIANKGSVTSGTITNVQQNMIINSKNTISYEYKFYDDYLYIKEINEYTNEYYYTYDKYGNVFGVEIQGSFKNRDEDAFEDNMNGPELKFNFLGDYDTLVYGAESYIEYFYNVGKNNTNGDFVSIYSEGLYTFGYGIRWAEDSTYFYIIGVSFAVDAETGALSQCAIMVQRYAEADYTVVDGMYRVNDNANPNSITTIVIEQSKEALEPTENPYDPDKITINDFTVRDTNGNDIEDTVINIKAGGQVKLFLKDLAPETALLEFSTVVIDVVYSSNGAQASYFPYYNSFDNSYSFTLNDPGTYILTVSVDEIEVSATIEVALKTPTSISTQIYDSALGVFNKTSKVEIYAGAPLYFMSYVPSDCNGAYIAELVEGIDATLVAGEIDGTAVTVFTANTPGTYKITLKSTVASSLTSTLTVTVVEAPSLDSILSGTYYANDNFGAEVITVTFDTEAKTATVEYAGMTAVLSYTTEDGFAYELTSGDDIVSDFYISESYELVIDVFGTVFVLEAAEKDIVATGTIEVVDVINNGKNNGTYTFELDSKGNFTFYKDGVVTTEISIRHDGTNYMFKFPSIGFESTLVKTSGTEGELAGTYDANTDNFGNVAKVTITVDEVQEPVKESTTGTIVVVDKAGNGKQNVTYTYEIIDGIFVIYKDGVVTTEATLSGANGIYIFGYPGVGTAQTLSKTSGEEGVLAGMYDLSMMLGATPYLCATVEIIPDPVSDDEPDEDKIETGTLVVVDNANGAVAGTYIYEIVNGAFVFYKDGAVTTDIIVTINLDGTYSFQAINCLQPQVLVKVEGEDGVLAGKYNVNGVMDGLFVLTFTPGEVEIPVEGEEPTTGTITVVDNSNGAVSGTYTYEIVNGGFVIYKDGVETSDIVIIVNIDGTYSFQAINCLQPQVLVKVEGEDGVLAGKYSVNSIMQGLFVITFAPGATIEDGGDDGDEDEPNDVVTELIVGDNAVSVPAGGWGVELPFTSAEGGKYKIEAAMGEANAVVIVFFADGSAEMINLPYEFTLEAGESLTFNICPEDYQADTIDLVISEVEDEIVVPSGPVVYQGTHVSGRLYQVTIDAEAGTMSVIRAALAGNNLNTANGAIECVFSYSFDGSTVTYELVSGSGCGAITFDENGAPEKLLWGSQEVTGFTVVE